jgi:hypothetical protein
MANRHDEALVVVGDLSGWLIVRCANLIPWCSAGADATKATAISAYAYEQLRSDL